jgi:ABC-2 type transport system permease protein
MTARQATYLTARREFRERVRSRAFRVGLLIQLVLVLGIALISALTGDDGAKTLKLGVSGQEAAAVGKTARAGQQAFSLKLELRRLPSPSAARAAVREDDVDLAVAGGRLYSSGDTDDQALALVRSAASQVRTTAQLRRRGLSTASIRRALTPPQLTTVEVTSKDDGGQGLAFVGVLLLYIAIITFGNVVASGVIEEKSSRVIELILSTIHARELLAGKVLGIGLVGLIQLLAVAGAGLALSFALGEVELPSSTALTAMLVAVYFILGYLLYACGYAMAGALVSRQEDAQSTTAPMTVVLIGGYVLSLSVIDEPNSTLAVICSFVPPVAPMIVPARAAQNALPLWELAASLALMVIGALLLIALAGRVYERAVLRLGAPIKLSQALKLAREPR